VIIGLVKLVEHGKVYDFLCYVAFRPQRKRGKRKRGSATLDHGRFDIDEYNEAKRKYFRNDGDNLSPLPDDALGYSQVNSYKAAIKRLYQHQELHNMTSFLWGHIWRSDCEELMTHVKTRKKAMDKRNYKEKMDSSFTCFKAKGKEELIEKELWESGNVSSLRHAFPPIRHRFIFLFTTSGILRGESLYSAELSDCFSVSHKNEYKDAHTWDALIMSMINGKTNRENKLYGRSLRAKDVRLCPVGALAFYLFVRFWLTEEFDDDSKCPDFTDNSSWYDIKLLVGIGTKGSRKESMTFLPYYNAIVKILRENLIPSNHFQHLGRILGSTHLQFAEIPDDEIRQLGNWQVSVRDLCYSTKLPLRAMRAAAGFMEGEGMFFCPRSQVVPEESLAKQVFPFAEEQLKIVDRAIREAPRGAGGNYLGAARGFLSMMMRLRIILLQDAAAMMILHPQRNSHPIFNSGTLSSVFITAEFRDFKEQMKRVLSSPQRPLDYNMQAIVPGIQARLLSNEQAIHQVGEETRLIREQTRRNGQEIRQLPNAIEGLLVRACKSIINGFQRPGHGGAASVAAVHGVVANTADSAADSAANCSIMNYHMDMNHSCVRGFYDEWFGLGKFVGKAIEGGIAECEKRFKKELRNKNSANRISRQARLCKAIDEKKHKEGTTLEDCCRELDEIYINLCRKSLTKFVIALQERDIIPKQKNRGKGSK